MRCGLLLYTLILPTVACAQATDLPGYVLQLPESVNTVLIAETDTATLYRYQHRDSALVGGSEQRMSIGKSGVGKQRSGDQRTPLGIYFVLEELDTSNLHEKYGPVAFPLDYPNAWDKLNDKTGYGIWIHGVTPNSGPRPVRDTDGCIALSNDILLTLEEYMRPLQTPVIVTRNIQRVSVAEINLARDELLSALQLWISSYRDGDWHRFLLLYGEDFEYRGMNRDEWSAYRVQTIGARPIDEFAVDEIMLLADPEQPNLYLSRFRQTIRESGRVVTTTKRLWWRKFANGDLRIVAEDNG